MGDSRYTALNQECEKLFNFSVGATPSLMSIAISIGQRERIEFALLKHLQNISPTSTREKRK